MYTFGTILLGVYWFLLVSDELFFHTRRRLFLLERGLRWIGSSLVAAACGYALFVEYDSDAALVFNVIAIASFVWSPLTDIDIRARVSAAERLLHGMIQMLHPLMLLFVLTAWRYIDGAGFFTNIVLPFSTRGLRPLMRGYFVAITALAVYQLACLIFFAAKRKSAAPLQTEAAPATLAASADEENAA